MQFVTLAYKFERIPLRDLVVAISRRHAKHWKRRLIESIPSLRESRVLIPHSGEHGADRKGVQPCAMAFACNDRRNRRVFSFRSIVMCFSAVQPSGRRRFFAGGVFPRRRVIMFGR